MLQVPNVSRSWAQGNDICQPHGGISSEEPSSRNSRRQPLRSMDHVALTTVQFRAWVTAATSVNRTVPQVTVGSPSCFLASFRVWLLSGRSVVVFERHCWIRICPNFHEPLCKQSWKHKQPANRFQKA